ncbi:RagB/SusD family nutrient uptake outer membrane protein [Segetibacter sp. 3557_3]|uniref:RagB/SusD family nutrient uptake outer membrane protein n=1 Tax=Segetibacter sp. 3557_3 TaxID=2547429 RepID=UPI001058E7D2|nr:RagB/SusD family nutrient uptake outer membrane protein [Segetibacter sp. 3557_3]TDH28595.1 RagB/SusD family nutrient uptake outer membrane protein [Segetibacter sp. 3557_3]
MKNLKTIAKYAALILPLVSINSCTKLDEKVYSRYVAENYYNTKSEVLSAVLRPYTHANAWTTPGQNGWWRVSELSADQLAWPVKGIDGQDGGNWIRDHYHQWTNDDEAVWGPWRLMWWGLGLCNQPIENLEKRSLAQMGITQEEKDAYVAELKLFRDFTLLKIMDLWGNVPVAITVGELNIPTQSRADVFKFLETDIKENIEKIPVLSPSMVGRMNRAGAYAMLVELYLNAAKWTGTPRWDDCIAACNKIISGEAGGQAGAVALDPNIIDTYSPRNSTKSKEILLSITYDPPKGSSAPQWPGDFYHFNQRQINGSTRNGNNGVIVIPGVYDGFYKNTDLRKKEWFLIGPQFVYGTTTAVTGTNGREYFGRPLVFVDNVRRNSSLQPGQDPNSLPSNMTTGEENSGVRFNKYKLGLTTDATNYQAVDWSLYRLTWVNFAKAEAIMRKNNGNANQEAVDLVNASKRRSFSAADWATEAYTPATLTLDELLMERGREFIFEGFRRQDLIRFDKFVTTEWWDHKATNDKNKELLPIPNRQITLNPGLKQNPGY